MACSPPTLAPRASFSSLSNINSDTQNKTADSRLFTLQISKTTIITARTASREYCSCIVRKRQNNFTIHLPPFVPGHLFTCHWNTRLTTKLENISVATPVNQNRNWNWSVWLWDQLTSPLVWFSLFSTSGLTPLFPFNWIEVCVPEHSFVFTGKSLFPSQL